MKTITNSNIIHRKLKAKNNILFPLIDNSIISLNKSNNTIKLLSKSIEIDKKKKLSPKEKLNKITFVNKELPTIQENKCSIIKYLNTTTNQPHKLYLKYPHKNNKISISPNHNNKSRNNNDNSLFKDKSHKYIHFRLVNGLDALSPSNGSRQRKSYHLKKTKKYLDIPKVDYTSSIIKIDQAIIGNTKAGNTNNGSSKINQDSYFIMQSNQNGQLYNIYGVMDGHGVNGQFVSNFISNEAQEYFGKYIVEKAVTKSKDCYDILISNNNTDITSFCSKVQHKLLQAKFDVHYSGSTCIIIIQIGHKLICINIGDSRGIIVSQKHNELSFSPIQLSIDHKPNEEAEKKRIEGSGGVVECEGEIHRVYFKDDILPGIAMSRSFGDEEAKTIGVSSEPDIFIRDICKEDKYIVVGSDGLWEFLDNKIIEQLVSPFYLKNDPKGAVNAIINQATQAWNEENCIQDDITVIVAFFEKDTNYL